MARAKITLIFLIMCKTEIFAEILSAVSYETEVPESLITSSDRTAEVVDARYLLVYFLSRRGFYASMIAPFIKQRKRSVNHIISNFESRLNHSPIMRVYFERLRTRWGGQ